MTLGSEFMKLTADTLHLMAVMMRKPLGRMARDKFGLAQLVAAMFVACCDGTRDNYAVAPIDNVKAKIHDNSTASAAVNDSR